MMKLEHTIECILQAKNSVLRKEFLFKTNYVKVQKVIS